MCAFKVGQRWISETEPELGLGILESVDRLQLRLIFPASSEARIYASGNAPIKRVAFQVGDAVQSQSGASMTIDSVEEVDGLLTYVGGGVRIPEAELADTISFSKPEERLINGQVDQSDAFALRYETLRRQHVARKSSVNGFAGGRIDLIPHQLYIASEVSNRYLPRVLLADEVGLGKTIEACLILHRLHLTGRAERILVLLPESLVHQWFVELLRRFNLWFTLFDAERCESLTAQDASVNPFLEEQLVICSVDMLVEHERWAQCAREAKWDMLVVDEAHHLVWTPEVSSPEYQLVEGLSAVSHGLLLLTATPEQLGAEGHFARLRLLDPDRYPDLVQFQEEQSDYAEVAAVADRLSCGDELKRDDVAYLRAMFPEDSDSVFKKRIQDRETLLAELVDRHGTGRVIFRNTRDALKGFPVRKALPASLEPRAGLSAEALQQRLAMELDVELAGDPDGVVYDFRQGPRIKWLADLLRELGDAKVLLICRSREKVEAVSAALLEEINVKAAVFHEELTLLQRDRNAAWFADPDGARILLCSEIGSEGRNFQFAHHLVLFDLPMNPELLEQRIGRLDRIGQTETIRVHVPYLSASSTELLLRWHHEGLANLEHSLKGGNAYLEAFGARVRELATGYPEQAEATLDATEELVADSAEFRAELEARLSKGQDKLIALNSYREDVSRGLVERIRELDTSRTIDGFMNRIFDHYGVTVDDVDERTYRLSPGHVFTDVFPGLPDEGTTITFARETALGREDIDFLTWDHPMVRGVIDLMLSSERGNSCMCIWSDPRVDAPAILIEAVFVLESVAPSRLHVDRFLSPTPVRVLVDMEGEDLSERYTHAELNRLTQDEEAFRLRENPQLLKALVPQMLKSARGFAREQKSVLLEAAMREAHARLDGEAARLRELSRVNPNVSEAEIKLADKVVADVTRHIAKSHLRLDGVRLVLRGG